MVSVYATLKLSLIVSTIVFIVMQLLADTLALMFLESVSETVKIVANGLRIFIVMLSVLSISFIGTAFFQSIAMRPTSMILSLLRQFIFLLPLVWLLQKN